MELKCGKCGNIKDIEMFSKNSKKKLGVNNTCKSCHSIYRKENYNLNKEKVINQVKAYKIANPEKYAIRNKKAGRTIESRCRVCHSIVYITKKDLRESKTRFCSEACKTSTYKTAYHYQLYSFKRRAEIRELDFDLDEEYIKNLFEDEQKNKCAVTGVPIKIKNKNEETLLYSTASLDRIDSSKGYVKGNVQWVLLGINYMKMDASNLELIKTLDLIIKYYSK